MTLSASPDLAPAEATRTNPFGGWAAQVVAQGDMSIESTKKYEPLWNAWCGWALSHGTHWSEVNAKTIQAFLEGPAPGVGGRRKAINPQSMSGYTRQRYWRLLRGVYAYAVRSKLMDSNPALDVDDMDRPSIARRDRQSQVLEPQMFEAMRKPRTITSTIALQSEHDWWHVRDRAILAMLISTGMTSAELIALRGMDVMGFKRQALAEAKQKDFDAPLPKGVVVDIMENAHTVGRTLEVADGLAELVLQWARCREILLRERAARQVPLGQRPAFMRENDSQGPFFVSRRARSTTTVLPPMEPVTLYYSVSQAMLSLRHKLGLDTADGPHVAKGPAVIRNSVIRRWLDTVGTEETVQRAGLKNAESLRLLPTLTVETLQ